MNSKPGLLECCVFLTLLACSSRADDFGVTQKTFSQSALPPTMAAAPFFPGGPTLLPSLAIAGSHTVFTLRNGRLIHELTRFDGTPPWGSRWVERFYADGQLAGIRAGVGAQWFSIHFTHSASMEQGGDRLMVGGETYELEKDGFYHVIADPKFRLQESVIGSAIFSTHRLDEERRKYLDPTPAPR